MKMVLIVDDEFDIAYALGSVFEEEGFEVRSCSNGRECLEELERGCPDLLMLDLMMPIMGGPEVLKVIRKDPRFARLPVILMSAVNPTESQEEYGWQAFLQKPFTLPALLERVHALVGAAPGEESERAHG